MTPEVISDPSNDLDALELLLDEREAVAARRLGFVPGDCALDDR